MTARHYALIASFVVAILAGPFLGGESITLANLWDPNSADARIFFSLRIPRVALALITGGSLAMLGAVYQILFQNPLAEPYILGVSSAATLGVALAELIFGVAAYSVASTLVGFGAAMALTMLLIWLCLAQAMERVVLFGMGMNFLLGAILFLTLSFFNQQVGGGALRWLFGQIPWITPGEALIYVGISLPFLIAILIAGRHLDAMSLGDDVAQTLRVSPKRTRVWLLFVTSAFLALLVAFTGSIGFVGLVVPHAVRLAFRPATSRQLLALSFLLGGFFLIASDVLARVILPPLEFPIGILTTILGGPAFLWLLWRRTR